MMPCNRKLKNWGVLLARLVLQEVSQRMLMIICSSTKHCNAIVPCGVGVVSRFDNMIHDRLACCAM